MPSGHSSDDIIRRRFYEKCHDQTALLYYRPMQARLQVCQLGHDEIHLRRTYHVDQPAQSGSAQVKRLPPLQPVSMPSPRRDDGPLVLSRR